jgi:hypothetical protein
MLNLFKILSLMLLSVHFVNAQQHDNIWLFGYSSNEVDSTFGGSVMDFSNDSLSIYYEYRNMNLDVTNASICDTSGNLLFYTNGIYIANTEHDTIENGGGINPGDYADDNSIYGYILNQGAIILPVPNSDSLFYLFHLSLDYPNTNVDWHSPQFYYSVIDMSLNNGLGEVIEKNVLLLDTTFQCGMITAAKHANGKDWWVLLNGYNSNSFYTFLISEEMPSEHFIQMTGSIIPHGLGQAVFSPDGSKYANISLFGGADVPDLVSIYDFDRCNGILSEPTQFEYGDSAWSGGIAISPNSQFLYVSSYNFIYQYDLFANDILASKDTVAIYDGFELEITPTFSLPTRFALMQLAPDGKIYINCPASVNLLHVINNPNEPGEACDIQQHSIELPTYNLFSLPNFPNYRLGPLANSECDSTTSIHEVSIDKSQLSIFPNPAYENIQLELEEFDSFSGKVTWEIYTSRGELIKSGIFNSKKLNISVLPYPNGVYFVKVIIEDGTFITERMVVQK